MLWMWVALGCRVSQPFEGPGFDDDGNFIAEPDGPVRVAVTHAWPARGAAKDFDAHVAAIVVQLEATDGVYGWSLRGEIGGRERWTMTLWEDEVAMVDFLVTGAHLAAMTHEPPLLDDAEFVQWEEPDPSALPPSWREATDRLDAE